MADLRQQLDEHQQLFNRLTPLLEQQMPRLAQLVGDSLASGGRLFVFGNGGSAADAQHLASEIVGRFELEREGLPAFALTTDSSILTSLSNDFGYAQIFARQVQALARKGDVVLGISTSGSSENVVQALEAAQHIGCHTAALLGRDGGLLRERVDVALVVPHDRTARIQEAHLFLIHALCALLDERFTAG